MQEHRHMCSKFAPPPPQKRKDLAPPKMQGSGQKRKDFDPQKCKEKMQGKNARI